MSRSASLCSGVWGPTSRVHEQWVKSYSNEKPKKNVRFHGMRYKMEEINPIHVHIQSQSHCGHRSSAFLEWRVKQPTRVVIWNAPIIWWLCNKQDKLRIEDPGFHLVSHMFTVKKRGDLSKSTWWIQHDSTVIYDLSPTSIGTWRKQTWVFTSQELPPNLWILLMEHPQRSTKQLRCEGTEVELVVLIPHPQLQWKMCFFFFHGSYHIPSKSRWNPCLSQPAWKV